MATMKGMPQHTPPPWTPAHVAELNAEQQRAGTSALHCGTPRHENVPLTATLTGWRCPLGCGYNPHNTPAPDEADGEGDVDTEPGPADGGLLPEGTIVSADEVGRRVPLTLAGGSLVPALELEETRRQATAWERKYFEMVEKHTPLAQRLDLAHQARRAKEAQLDEIRRALCDTGLMRDDDPYSHADLADVIRQAHSDRSDRAVPEEPPCKCGHPASGHGQDPVLCRGCTRFTGGLRYHPEHLYQPATTAQPEPDPEPQPSPPAGKPTGRRHPLSSPAWQPGDGHARCGYVSLNADGPYQCMFRAGHPPHGHAMRGSDLMAVDPGSPEDILVALHKLHRRGSGFQTTPLGPVTADDVCVHCRTAWPCPTGRILHTAPALQEQP